MNKTAVNNAPQLKSLQCNPTTKTAQGGISEEEAKKLVNNVNKLSPRIFKSVVLMVSSIAHRSLNYTTALQCLKDRQHAPY